MVYRAGGVVGDGVHVDGKFANLAPALGGVGEGAKAHCGVEVEDGAWMDGEKG